MQFQDTDLDGEIIDDDVRLMMVLESLNSNHRLVFEWMKKAEERIIRLENLLEKSHGSGKASSGSIIEN